MAGKRKAAGRAASRSPLTREAISRAALQLIDREGLDGLSMRQLGRDMGVEGMAIYHHFRDKGELLDAVMERLFEERRWPGCAESSVPTVRSPSATRRRSSSWSTAASIRSGCSRSTSRSWRPLPTTD